MGVLGRTMISEHGVAVYHHGPGRRMEKSWMFIGDLPADTNFITFSNGDADDVQMLLRVARGDQCWSSTMSSAGTRATVIRLSVHHMHIQGCQVTKTPFPIDPA